MSTAHPDLAHAPLAAKRLGLLTQDEAIVLMRADCHVCRSEGLAARARVLLVNDPMGGRPVSTISVNAGGSNAVAETVAPGGVTITAEPETPVSGPGITIVGDDVPDGDPVPGQTLETANADGLLPDLLEETEHGAIPRIAASPSSADAPRIGSPSRIVEAKPSICSL